MRPIGLNPFIFTRHLFSLVSLFNTTYFERQHPLKDTESKTFFSKNVDTYERTDSNANCGFVGTHMKYSYFLRYLQNKVDDFVILWQGFQFQKALMKTLKKRDRIISKVKSKYWQTTHKYGIRVPKSIQEALDIDKENGDTRWQDAIRDEMKNVRVAF